MNDNLIPIKPGQQLALKHPSQRRTECIKVMVTKAEKFSFAERVKQEQAKNMSALARKILEL